MQKRYLSCNTRGSLSITAATFCREQNRYSHYKKQRHIYMHDKDTPTSAQQHLLRDYYRKLSHQKLLNCIGKCPEYSGKHPQLKTLPKRIVYQVPWRHSFSRPSYKKSSGESVVLTVGAILLVSSHTRQEKRRGLKSRRKDFIKHTNIASQSAIK